MFNCDDDEDVVDVYDDVSEVIDDDDLVTEKTKLHYSLEDWKKTWMSRMNGDAVFISALNKENLQEFKKSVYDKVKEIHVARFPYNSFLYTEYTE